MKFICTQENFIKGIQLVSHSVGKNTHLPILENVLLKIDGGSLRLSTTNLELASTCLVRGKVENEGEYTAPVKLLLEYVTLIPSGKIEIQTTEEGLEIKTEDQETCIRGIPASEFPVLPKIGTGAVYELQAQEFRRGLGQVSFAVLPSESRPELMGVACFFGGENREGKVTCVATDSYRLAERTLRVHSGDSQERRVTIPAKTCVEITRVLGMYTDELLLPENATLQFTENQLSMTYGNIELISRLVEGSFPEYAPLIPTTYTTEAIVNRAELQKAVRVASLFSRQGIFDIQFSFDPEKGTCTVQSADQGTGKTKNILQGKITGEPNTSLLNFKYLAEGLAAIGTNEIRIRQVDQINPLLILPEGTDEEYRYIVMPIRQ